MDPKANLEEQLKLAHEIATDDYLEWLSNPSEDEISEAVQFKADAYRLAELVLALDEWRKQGGFDPYSA